MFPDADIESYRGLIKFEGGTIQDVRELSLLDGCETPRMSIASRRLKAIAVVYASRKWNSRDFAAALLHFP